MQRKEWFELHDQRLFPRFLRDLVTDALEALWRFGNSYRVIVPRLALAMQRTGTREVVDLCSGGGGPWPTLHRRFEEKISVRLTDRYPNLEAFQHASQAAGTRIGFERRSIDAKHIPARLTGFRTMFSSFHHFNPADARAILADAARQGRGIAIFEAAKRDARTLVLICTLPFAVLALTPAIRPFRWQRLFWTYLVPVVPFTVWFDGIMSCLRSYSVSDMRELTEGLGTENYSWEVGEERSGRVRVVYLIGAPRNVVESERSREVEQKQVLRSRQSIYFRKWPNL